MPQPLLDIYVLIFGLCFGSFANVVIYRLPRKLSIIMPPSHCPACNKRLAARDLFPVISWMALRGRCRFCGVCISLRYPTVEAVCAGLFFAMARFAGMSLSTLPLCLLAFVLLCVSFIDWDTQEIPDGLLIFGFLVGLAWLGAAWFSPALFPFAPLWHDALLGLLAGALPLFLLDQLTLLLVKKDGFGFGDVKLMAVLGLFLGWQMTFAAFFFAFVAGGTYGAFLLITRRAEQGTYIAFGPFLCAGSLLALWFGKPFIKLLIGIDF